MRTSWPVVLLITQCPSPELKMNSENQSIHLRRSGRCSLQRKREGLIIPGHLNRATTSENRSFILHLELIILQTSTRPFPEGNPKTENKPA